ncbi:ankyrin repeat domain-containing protein [Nonlabens antarcticus]|uniref:ankyrin repeat domain-containing protein n=1 Tax=Nonlabens antarcticus TaxID=392714 RepID=UPI00189163E1|nr:ankyrin repeat domain-containing protein [Nonlabens antarcticus]
MNKIILSLILFAMTLFMQAQSITEDQAKQIIKNDAVEFLNEFANNENINQCIEINASNYNLLSLTIKYEAYIVFKAMIKNYELELNATCGGKTPLMYAAKYGRKEMASALVAAGADVGFKYKGRTAVDYAKKCKQPELVKLFEEYKNLN